MTYLALSSVPVSRTGVDITGSGLTSIGANTGVSFKNAPYMALVVYNGSASTITATPQITKTIEGQAPSLTGLAVSIPTLHYNIIGSLSLSDFLSTDGTGNTYIVFATAAATIMVGLIDVPYTA